VIPKRGPWSGRLAPVAANSQQRRKGGQKKRHTYASHRRAIATLTAALLMGLVIAVGAASAQGAKAFHAPEQCQIVGSRTASRPGESTT
jgi:hypothetical protein